MAAEARPGAGRTSCAPNYLADWHLPPLVALFTLRG